MFSLTKSPLRVYFLFFLGLLKQIQVRDLLGFGVFGGFYLVS